MFHSDLCNMLYDKQYMKMENDKVLTVHGCYFFLLLILLVVICFILILSVSFSALTFLFCSVLATLSAFLILFSSSLSFFRLL